MPGCFISLPLRITHVKAGYAPGLLKTCISPRQSAVSNVLGSAFFGNGCLRVFKGTSRCQFAGNIQRAVFTTMSAEQLQREGKEQAQYGFLGLGIMGEAMVMNLLKRGGYNVTVWNRTADKCKHVAEAGATVASTPAEVVERCSVTFAMLADPKAAHEVFFGHHGASHSLKAGKGYVDCSTVDPETSMSIAAEAKKKQSLFLEAPVSGSKKPAQDGQLIFLTSGDKELYEKVLPALSVMGKRSFFLGKPGAGAEMKLVVNAVMGIMMAGFAEGLALGQKLGLSQQDILDVLDLGAMANPMFRLKGPSMIEGVYSPAFPLKHQQKDLRLVLDLAEKIRQPVPMSSAADAQYREGISEGFGDLDFSAVLEVLKTEAIEDSAAENSWWGN